MSSSSIVGRCFMIKINGIICSSSSKTTTLWKMRRSIISDSLILTPITKPKPHFQQTSSSSYSPRFPSLRQLSSKKLIHNNINNNVVSNIINPPHYFNAAAHTKRLFFSSSSSSSSSNALQLIVNWYLGMNKTRPILTKSITCAFIYIAADFSSQTITGESTYDFIRTLRMAGCGMIIVGPGLHYWYNSMSRLFPNTDLVATFKKLFLGFTVYGPIITVVLLSVNALLQGESGSEIIARLKRDFIPTMTNGIMYWSVCDFIIFKFIPVHLQPLMSNSFSYIWTIYMTYMASLEKAAVTK